jgi:hypothetical protein
MQFPKRCGFLFLEYRTMDEVQKPSSPELQHAPSHVPSTRREVVSPAAGNNATAISYRDSEYTVGGNPDAKANTAPATNFVLDRHL